MIRHVLILLWNIIGATAAGLTLPGSIELLLLSLAALVPRKAVRADLKIAVWRAAVVIPAHNEQLNISSCVQSLLAADSCGPGVIVDIFVIADNCTDQTGALAAQAGALVLERHNPVERGKGYALDYAFGHLIESGYDCMLVVDADTHVQSNFLTATLGCLRAGAQAVQTRYLVRNATETMRSRLMRVSLLAFNLVRPLGRDHLGLSCGILGNGFGLRREALLAVPYLASSIVEDLEYHIALVRSGRRVAFVNDSGVYAETPVKAKDVRSQRSRWEGGRLRMLATAVPSLCGDVLAGRLRCVEPLLDLLLLPLAFHVTLLAVALSAPLLIVHAIGVTGALIIVLHLVATIALGGGGWRDAAILAAAPFYVLWKIMLIPTLVRSSRASEDWVRTGRNAEPAPADAAASNTDHTVLR